LNISFQINSELGKFSKHYENFPVASFLIPNKKRNVIRLIYWFARTADDFADEGNLSPEKRMILLNEFENEFLLSLTSQSKINYLNLLSNEIKLINLDSDLFLKLLSAFKQDVVKSRYVHFDEVLDYCSRSANPIGRLLLQLFGYESNEIFSLSDKICTSLQLINFIQDTKIDISRNRLYYPIDELENFKVSESDLLYLKMNDNIKRLIKFNVDRARDIMNQGKELTKKLKGKFAVEIRWTILGGEEILKKIAKIDYNVVAIRPTISKLDYVKIFIRSLLKL
jgi:squalene synthase HpnC